MHLSSNDGTEVMSVRPEGRSQRGAEPTATSDAKVASYCSWKGGLDRIAAAILLVPGLPVIGVLALLVRLTSPGPGIFRQKRVGRDGRHFTMYKIRTMSMDAEHVLGAVWAKSQDGRVTPLGHVLRKLHLDELPQLLNVLWGDMSLVGPRPERPEFVTVLARELPSYRDRLAVRPGITGLAQVNLPPDTDIKSVQRKLALDVEYIRAASLGLDLRLLLCTVGRMLRLPVHGVLRVRRQVALPEMASASCDACLVAYASPESVACAGSNGARRRNGEASHPGADDLAHSSPLPAKPR
jgi:lipopolysaccharide/colanic/teichoic acid biosynthesis glycosyltransferase